MKSLPEINFNKEGTGHFMYQWHKRNEAPRGKELQARIDACDGIKKKKEGETKKLFICTIYLVMHTYFLVFPPPLYG